MDFRDLGLIDPILNALAEQGYETPTPIQRGAIPPALKGRDVLGCAQTGTGKTCAFAAPILQRLHGGKKHNPRVIRALILTPTRELALQIQECFEAYGKHLPLRSAVIFGGVGQQPQVDQLKRGVDILVATPGRLLDLHNQKLLDLSHIEIFVLDEADRMLDMGFIHDVRRVLKVLPQKKQTLFFSATMPPEVMELVNALLHDYARVAVDPISSPVEVIRQSLYFVDKSNKTKLLAHLIGQWNMDSVLVFSRTKHGANRIAGDLIKRGIPAAAIHGNKSQTARVQALNDFKAGRVRALIATDIAARGIDIDELKWVVNYDLPEVAETYVHRIGRTGRAGHDGSALSFCRADEKDYLKQIEKLLGRKLPVVEDHPFPMTEAPTGVDPMLQAKLEGKENARASRQGKKAASKPQPQPKAEPVPVPVPDPQTETEAAPAKKKKRRKKKKAAAPVSAPAAEVVQPVPAAEMPKQTASKPAAPKPAASRQTSKRGVRQGDLSATMPAAPSMPVHEFVKPNPLDSDVIMDATARLLAPRKPMFSTPKAEPEQARQSGGKKKHSNNKKNAQSKKQAEQPAKQEAKQPPMPPKKETAPKPAPQPKKASGPSAPPAKGENKKKNRSRRDRPRPMERSLYAAHSKDSTEQRESIIKPYYLSDD